MIILDIETVPDKRYLFDPPDWFVESRFNPQPKMGNLKDPAKIEAKISDWEEKGGKIRDLSTCIWTAKPIMIGIYDDDNMFRIIIPIDSVVEYLEAKYFPLITFNAKKFDLPILVRYFAERGKTDEVRRLLTLITSPYDSTVHIDLYYSFPDCPSLDVLAKFLGVKEEKYGDGADIYQWYLKGEMGEIDKHCIQDLKITKSIANKLGY